MKKPAIASLLVITLAGCMGYVPGQQSYWDAQIKEMCEKDGGVTIFEQIVVSTEQAVTLPKVGDFFGVAPEALAKPEEPAFIRTQITQIRSGNPSVVREKQEIIRRSDKQIVGQVVRYGRGGGDFPSFAHPSTFSCPEYMKIYEGIHKLYRVEEIRK